MKYGFKSDKDTDAKAPLTSLEFFIHQAQSLTNVN